MVTLRNSASRLQTLTLMIIAGLAELSVLYLSAPASGSQPFNPTLENTAISDQTPGANANITFRTALPAGDHVLGSYGLIFPPNSFDFEGDKRVADNHVTAVGTMDVTLDMDGNCSTPGTPQAHGPFPLVDMDAGSGQGAPLAKWFGTIADFTSQGGGPWTVTLTVDGSLTDGFIIDGAMILAVLPPGATLCTPQIFTLTICGKANPTSTATVCGSGADEVGLTNPASDGT